LLSLARLYQDRKTPLEALPTYLKNNLRLFEQLRFARLCAFLRQRAADEFIGYSILVYWLTDDDLQRALYLPPAELKENDFN